ncbi:hypothetical protein GLOTRDRAFT_112471 [Gloeophyllum trabeum ATCC 11539]|uniref:Uncharacterized protein n=1 Tax=Gloeophyllum trabeum (strain ATCC 11539 / FP-39264 / Madison 617) TaxID=670483 RepID=S7RAE3_GLOTA|nr:uncharacterized protein GLOTRDRAFT_112471 [Gloeophyllum trabeum ATCC 11539]EPQ51230.1 hypothetical protein GLOTRDRAFT_112471 [Gloeophyllum trabeum ATCC 11539]
MATRVQKVDPSKTSSSKINPEQLMALPSLTHALSSLPQAKSLDGVPIHRSTYPSMSAQHAAESEAKLKKALSKTAASQSQNVASKNGYAFSHSPDRDQGLMMRKPLRTNLQV